MEVALTYTTAQLIVGTFLLVTLVIGLWAGRNVRDMRDYALANRQFGATILTFSFLATLIDGSDTQTLPGRIFSIGLVECLSRFGMALAFLLFGWLIAPKLFKFKGCLTLGEIAELLFGSNARIITGLFGFLGSILWISIQMMVLGPIGASLLGISETYTVLIGGMIMVVYASLGGVRAVTMTDIIQFVTLILCVTLIAGRVVYQIGGIKAFASQVSTLHPERLCIISHPRFPIKSFHFVSNALGLSNLFLPSFMQRLLMGKDSTEARKMLVGSAGAYILFIGAIIIIALGGVVLFPEVIPSQIMSHISTSLFPKNIQAILQVGLIAVVMSTVDSHLSSSGLVLTHDVFKPLCDRFNLKINELRIVKWVTFITGSLSMVLAVVVGPKGLLSTIPILVDYANDAISIIGVPMCIGLMGLITDRKSFIAGVSVAAAMLVGVRILNLDAVTSELMYLGSMVANAVAYLTTHYFVNNGFKFNEVIEVGRGDPPIVKVRKWVPSQYDNPVWFDNDASRSQNTADSEKKTKKGRRMQHNKMMKGHIGSTK